MGMTSKEYHEGYQQGFKDAKADYENRLKADLVAMLEDLDLQIDELTDYNFDNNFEVTQVQRLIRDKINLLKEAQDVSS